MKKLIYSIMVGFLLTLGVIGTSSMEVDAAVIVSKLDFDLNGTIDIDDIAEVAFNYQLTCASNNWSPKFDLNADNIVDIYDIVLISKAMGTSTMVNDNTDITSKFIDEKFKSLIYKTINKSNSAPILYSDVKGITEIKAVSLEISNLSGIEYFTSLTDLDCSKNAIRTLNLSNNTKLTDLYCSNNQLEGLNLTSNTELMTLDCTSNTITTLNLSNNPKLAFLFCSNNKLQSLNVNNNVLLEYLNCESNELKGLDVSKNKVLWWLICNFNDITRLDLSLNTGLMSLECSNNQLTTLDISKNSQLTTLKCNFNNITTLDVSANIELVLLECSNNQLTTLDISKNSELGRFNCTRNQIIALYSTKNTWLENYYKEQYTDASHKITTNNLDIEIIINRGGSIVLSATDVVNEARKHLGKPYVYGTRGPDSFDCSGFTYYVYKIATGIDIGSTTYKQVESGREVSQSELQPGDLVFTSPSHVGIYIGDDNMIHASQTGDFVKISKVYSFYAGRRILS